MVKLTISFTSNGEYNYLHMLFETVFRNYQRRKSIMERLYITSVSSSVAQPNTPETDAMATVNHNVIVYFSNGENEVFVINVLICT
jgi:hypothetical protein